MVPSISKLDVCGVGETLDKKERNMVKRWRTEGVTRATGPCHRGTRGGSLFTAASWLLAVALLLEAHPAWAQISKVNTVMTNVQTVLVG